jgi:predicted nucleic acid-binding protein
VSYPDTSFLCAAYRYQTNYLVASAHWRKLSEPLPFTSLLEFEFLQAVELQVFIHATDRTKGYPRQEADRMIAAWQADVAGGLARQVAYDAEAVNALARTYSQLYTAHGGHRSLDILHVATAVHLRADTFLTFDARQKKLAKAVGLKVPF